jgi:hypothetical protein
MMVPADGDPEQHAYYDYDSVMEQGDHMIVSAIKLDTQDGDEETIRDVEQPVDLGVASAETEN